MLVEKIWTHEGEVTASGSGFEPEGRLTAEGLPIEVREGTPLAALLTVSVLCNDAVLLPPSEAGGSWRVAGDPTEGALLAMAAKAGTERDEADAASAYGGDPVRL